MVSNIFSFGVFCAWVLAIVANKHTKSVFILQLHSPSGNYSISFNLDMFERFYRCLQSDSSSSCLVHHTHTSLTQREATNVTYEYRDPAVFSSVFLKTSFCVSDTAGVTSCAKWNTDNLKNENGIHFDFACNGGKCNNKCVYINNGNLFSIMDKKVIKPCDYDVVQTETTNIFKHLSSQPTAFTLTNGKTSAQRTTKPYTTKANILTSRSVNTAVDAVTITAKHMNHRTRTTKPTAQTTNTPARTADTSTNVLPSKTGRDKVTSDSGIIIGIIVSLIVVLLIVITIVCLYRRNRKDNQHSCHCSISSCRSNTKTLQNGCSRFFAATVCLTNIRNIRQSSNDGQNRSRGDAPVTISSDDNISTTYSVPTRAAAQIANNGFIYSILHQVITVPENPYNVASDGNNTCFVDSAYETVDPSLPESGSGIVLGDGEVEIIDLRNGSQLQEFSDTNCSSRRISTSKNAERGTKRSNSYVNSNFSSSSVPQEPKSHIYFELEDEAKNNCL